MKAVNYKAKKIFLAKKIIINKVIPSKRKVCWNLFGFIFVRDRRSLI